jgi:hypothetical protein
MVAVTVTAGAVVVAGMLIVGDGGGRSVAVIVWWR